MISKEIRERQPITELTIRFATTRDIERIFQLTDRRKFDVPPPVKKFRPDLYEVLGPRFENVVIREHEIIRSYIEGMEKYPDQHRAVVASTSHQQADGKSEEQIIGVLLADRNPSSNICEISEIVVDKEFEG